ncbi:SIS binding protein [Perkinsus chesapeaki]|uniref:SIS binding protein n=1 Tax=Perkinsus chesapeaki TaxID=330153 RepID=A0A7J6LG38_PERCH|nr:SIS binding protein [Perkinsus chesapeaki]
MSNNRPQKPVLNMKGGKGKATSNRGPAPPQLKSELVEDMTALRMGKTRLVSKNKNKPSKLKEVIMHDQTNEEPEGNGVPEISVRHYVHQYLSPELDSLVLSMLEDLCRYQERAKENPAKFKKRKRFVTGLREVERALRLGKLQGIIVAPNMHSSESSGGLDEHVVGVVEEASMGGGRSSATASSRNGGNKISPDRPPVPVVFALSKNRLGKACGKPVRQCAVGLLSVEGAESKWKQVTKMAEELRSRWLEDRLAQPAEAVNGEIEGT